MIRDIHLDGLTDRERPLNRLSVLGAGSLSDTELLSLLLHPGATSADECTNLARQAMATIPSLRVLARCALHELGILPGVSLEQAAALVAAFELGRRVSRESTVRLTVDSPEIVCRLMSPDYDGMTRESVRVLLLDIKSQLIRIEEVSIGSVDTGIAHPREVFRPAIAHGAQAIILVHNHPSGNPSPSKADHALTQQIVQAGDLLQIRVIDHIIVGAAGPDGAEYYSFREASKI